MIDLLTMTVQLIGRESDGIRICRVEGESLVTVVVPHSKLSEAKKLPGLPHRGICKPIGGSSITYSTPVVRLRTERASCTRWRSPVESVDPARSSERYPKPRCGRRLAVLWNDSQIDIAMGRISSGRLSGTPATHSTACSSVISAA